MILYKSWGEHLRLGNWWHLYTGLSSISQITNNPLCLPPYFAWQYMENPPLIDGGINQEELFHFRQTNYTKEEYNYLINFFSENRNKKININLGSHLQSELWIKDNLDYVKTKLVFKKEAIDRVRNKYSNLFEDNKELIGIGVRRGDFVSHGCFYQIPESWYFKALEAEFPNWKDCKVVVFSDDIEWCKKYFKDKPFYYAEANNTHTHSDNFKHYHKDPMEQFILGTLCNGFIGGSSTFSWWQMWYVKNFNNGKVVHSGKNLRGECLKKFYNPDFYPDSWILYEK